MVKTGAINAIKDVANYAVKNFTLIIGFACAIVWSPTVIMASTAASSLNQVTNAPPHGTCMPLLLASSASSLVILLLAKNKRNFMQLFEGLKPIVLGFFMTAVAILFSLPMFFQQNLPLVLNGAIIASGLLLVPLYLLWVRRFGKLSNQEMFLTLCFAQVLSGVASAAFSLMNAYTILTAVVVLPLVSVRCLQKKTEGKLEGEGSEPELQRVNNSPSRKLWFKFAVLIFVWGVTDHLFRGEFDVAIRSDVHNLIFPLAAHLSAITTTLVIIGSAYGLIVFGGRYRFGHLYRLLFLLGLGTILILPVALTGPGGLVGYTGSTTMYELVFLFMWVITASAFHLQANKAPQGFALVYGCWSLGSFFGAFISTQIMDHLAFNGVSILVLVAALAVTVCYVLVFSEQDADSFIRIIPFKYKTPFRDKCLAVADKYKLTARETEVVQLIARGRDSAYIQEKLVLSRSTIQTHRMHIYQKIDIHNRQELLDIIESFGKAKSVNE